MKRWEIITVVDTDDHYDAKSVKQELARLNHGDGAYIHTGKRCKVKLKEQIDERE